MQGPWGWGTQRAWGAATRSALDEARPGFGAWAGTKLWASLVVSAALPAGTGLGLELSPLLHPPPAEEKTGRRGTLHCILASPRKDHAVGRTRRRGGGGPGAAGPGLTPLSVVSRLSFSDSESDNSGDSCLPGREPPPPQKPPPPNSKVRGGAGARGGERAGRGRGGRSAATPWSPAGGGPQEP